jgi:MarR family 2-MHQ and catechol resistance regulon transcriptional repressor
LIIFELEIIAMHTTARYGKKADLALQMWVKLARAAATFDKLSAENIRSFGLTAPQFGAFECLGHLGSMTTGELARKMLVSGGNTTCIVDNLMKEGLVEREHSANDRRVIVVRLSEKGQKLFDEIFPKHALHIEHLASVLTAEEQADLARLLKKLGKALSED